MSVRNASKHEAPEENEMTYSELLASTQVSEEYNLHTNLAKGVEKMLREELSKEISKQLTNKYDTPNCTG